MTPTTFPEANERFGPPPDLEESQCATIPVYLGTVARGSVEGSRIVVAAWLPSPQERIRIAAGAPVFVAMLGGLAPHTLTTSFEEAVNVP